MQQYDNLIATEVHDAAVWRQILERLPAPAHPLQSWAWGAFKSRWGWQMRPTVWSIDGTPRAAAMLLQRPLGRSGLSMLYAPKGPVLRWQDADLRCAVLRRLQTMARHDRAVFVKIDPDVVLATGVEPAEQGAGRQVVADLQTAGWHLSPEQIQFRNTVMIDLTLSEEQLLKNMKQKTRYNIRLAARREVSVRAGTPADFGVILQLYGETGDRNEFMLRPDEYYRDGWQSMWDAGMLHILIAEYDGEPLAAVLLVYSDELCIYMYGASTDAHRNRMPAYLLQWEAICWARAHGCRHYDMWGAPDQFDEQDRLWGVWRFKSGFNGVVTRHIGAWDYAAYPQLYKLLGEALPRYRSWLRNRRA